jgi:2-oxoglutarate dehydrogenase complex dehydrogenase (E1) component-like enzyme
MMYQEIHKRPNIYNLYKNKLISEGSIDETTINNLWEK